jgi:hypothetical protein
VISSGMLHMEDGKENRIVTKHGGGDNVIGVE